MIYYPVFLNLEGLSVLVVGAGPVAVRKARGLVEAGARVTVVAPEGVEEEMLKLKVVWAKRRFRSTDLRGKTLVFAATNSRAVNAEIALKCKAAGVWVNVADAPEECGFLVPARVRDGNLQIAATTGGEDPRMAKAMRERLETILGEFREKLV